MRAGMLIIITMLLLNSCAFLKFLFTPLPGESVGEQQKVECCCTTEDNLQCCVKVYRCSKLNLITNGCQCK